MTLENIRPIKANGKGLTRLTPAELANLDDEDNFGERQRLVTEHRLTQRGQIAPRFQEARFLASIKSARIAVGGDLEITLSVPVSEKYAAIPLTDAAGILVVIHAQRKRRNVYDLSPVPDEQEHPDALHAERLQDADGPPECG